MEGLESFFTVSEQLRLFLMSCLLGVPVGVAYDIFRALRIVFPHGKILTAAEDLLFFLLYGVFIMCFTVTAARSQFRFYFCIGNLIGFTVYFFTLGSIVTAVFKSAAEKLRSGFYIVFRPAGGKFVVLCKKIGRFFVGTLQKLKMNKKNS